MTDPGWYPDPMGLWDVRWWDGTQWVHAVRTGEFQSEEPLVDVRELVARPVTGGLVWSGERAGDPAHPRAYALTDAAVSTYRSLSEPPTESVPLWSIAASAPRINAGQAMRGVGDVALTIAYPGYGGRATHVLRSVLDPRQVSALIARYARLDRMRQHFPRGR